MNSHTLSAPADAYPPDADRAGPAMPENIARLLTILRVLLDFGRSLAATIERRAATPDFWLFSAVFGTSRVPVILAHLHRGILRAATLKSLLLQRAAAGRDVTAAPLHAHPPATGDANADPCDEPFDAQRARLTAERARHDAPVDPDNLATAEQIEAEVRARPIGRSLADIRRDLGIVACMCTRRFWDTVTDAIACFEVSVAVCSEDMQPGPEPSAPAHETEPPKEKMQRGEHHYARRRPGFKTAGQPIDPLRPNPAPAGPHDDVPIPHRRAAVATHATGPPLRAAMQRAA